MNLKTKTRLEKLKYLGVITKESYNNLLSDCYE